MVRGIWLAAMTLVFLCLSGEAPWAWSAEDSPSNEPEQDRLTIDDAIQMLDSESRAERKLAVRTLGKQAEDARPKIVAAIEQDWFRYPEPEENRFRKLRALIGILGTIGEGTPEGAVGKLLDKHIAHIVGGAPEPSEVVIRKRRSGFEPEDIDREDANHCLAWLVASMDKAEVARHYARRLIELHKTSPKRWKYEVQLALDVAYFNTGLDLAAAIKRTKIGKPIGSTSGMQGLHTDELEYAPAAIAFSPDSQQLAAAIDDHVSIVKVDDWSSARVIHGEEPSRRLVRFYGRYSRIDRNGSPIRQLAYAQDGRQIYVMGPNDVGRYLVESGKRDATFKLPGEYAIALQLVPGVERMVALSADKDRPYQGWYQDYRLSIHDTQSGKVLQSFDLPKDSRAYAIAPKSGRLVYAVPGGCKLASLAGEATEPVVMPLTDCLTLAAFTPNEKLLLTVESQRVKDGKTWLRARSEADGFKVVAEVDLSSVPEKVDFRPRIGTVPNRLAISPDGKYLTLVLKEWPYTLAFSLDGLKPLQAKPGSSWSTLWAGDSAAVAFSPDARTLVRTTERDGCRVYAFPSLEELGQIHNHGERWADSDDAKRQAALFSPDGRWLVLLDPTRPTLRLFRTRDAMEIMPYQGHGDEVESVTFLPDGKQMRRVGRDQVICTWDTATMKMISRVVSPDWVVRGLSEPDARYALCLPAALRTDREQCRLRTIDALTGKVVSEVVSPIQFHAAEDEYTFWLGNGVVEYTRNIGRVRINYLTGAILAAATVNNYEGGGTSPMYGRLSEDRRRLWHLDDWTDFKFGWPPRWKIEQLDFQSLRPLQQEHDVMPEDFPNGPSGLVPGGKYFHLGTQIYDRKTCRLVSEQRFRGMQVAGIAFNADGSRYAVVVDGPVYVDEPWDSERQSLACICDTQTGAILRAWPVPKRTGTRKEGHGSMHGPPPDNYHILRFSPDDRRLAIVNADGTLDIWELSEPASR